MSKFKLMEGWLGELERPADARAVPRLRDAFLLALQHAQRALLARGIVTFFLAASAITALAATVLNVLVVPPGIESGLRFLLERAAAVGGSLTVLLIALRLGVDRYLDHVEARVTFLAIELAAARAKAPD